MYFTEIEIENIKCFSGKQALRLTNINGSISPWTLILGNNGSGKTTMLKCIAWMTAAEETDLDIKKEEKGKNG